MGVQEAGWGQVLGFPCWLLFIQQSSVLPAASGHESVKRGHKSLGNDREADTEDENRKSPLCKRSSSREGACIIKKNLTDVLQSSNYINSVSLRTWSFSLSCTAGVWNFLGRISQGYNPHLRAGDCGHKAPSKTFTCRWDLILVTLEKTMKHFLDLKTIFPVSLQKLERNLKKLFKVA